MMFTRCPSCATVFRVTATQLKARQAQVRCGHCRSLFNALDTLVDSTVSEALASPQSGDIAPDRPPATPQDAAQPVFQSISEPMTESGASSEAWPPIQPDEQQTSRAALEEAALDLETLGPPQTSAYSVFFRESGIATDDLEGASAHTVGETHEDSLTERLEPVRRPHRWPWVLAIALLAVAVLLQALLQFRNDFAVYMPQAKPILEQLCLLRGCKLSLPHKVEFLSIEASDLHPSGDTRGSLILLATLRNRASFTQAYPSLELTLTDVAELPLLRKIIAPKDYLLPGTNLQLGFAANSEKSLNLALETTQSAAAGYRLYLFYP
jgi:predicted Zn finger-like uncharacterized protein